MQAECEALGKPVHIIGRRRCAAELIAKRAIKAGTELGLAVRELQAASIAVLRCVCVPNTCAAAQTRIIRCSVGNTGNILCTLFEL